MSWLQRRLSRRQDRFVIVSTLAILAITSCANVEVTDKIDYRTAAPPKPLDIPPDLSQLPKEDRYQVPSASANSAANAAIAANAVNVTPHTCPLTLNKRLAACNSWIPR